MKQITFTLFLLLSASAFCQTTFRVDDFSEDYYGKVYISNISEVFSQGWVAIYDKKTDKELIKVDSAELYVYFHDGKVLANINETPYGEQSAILYEDFNFDGINDFAIMDGQNSCYHGPSFQVYLATNNGFKHSSEFTQLAQKYCGMFSVHKDIKTISTMTKSGCCSHQYSDFKVKNNIPYPIEIVEEELSSTSFIMDCTEQNLINGKMKVSSYQKFALDMERNSVLLSFAFENKKRMRIFGINGTLYYTFTDNNEKIELLYDSTFKYSKSQNTLSFSNKDTQYIVYEDKIIAKKKGKTYEMKAANGTKSGTLSTLKELKFDNMEM